MKVAKIMICAVLAVMFLSFQAQDVKALTYTFDYNIGSESYDPSDLGDFLSHNGADSSVYDTATNPFSGDYDATFIGYRANNINTFNAPETNNQFITDPNAATGPHSTAGDSFAIDGATAYFDDTTNGPTGIILNSGTDNIMSYILNKDWTYTGNSGIELNFYKGDIIVGFGDGAGDNDYLDLVIALNPGGDEVPIPGAVWLLGSGLLGLVGIRRRRKL